MKTETIDKLTTPEKEAKNLFESNNISEKLLNSGLKHRATKKSEHMYNKISTDQDEEEFELAERVSDEEEDKYSEKKKVSKPLKEEWASVVLLVTLYLLQGIPMGLCFGSLPFLLRDKLSYSDLALFSLTGYPYSLKLLWSPIVDSIYFKSFGRRKTWIVPIQLLAALLLYYLGYHVDGFLNGDHFNVGTLTLAFSVLVFLSATQDIAVDGWALTLLSEENLSYASTCQTIGLNTGYFLSFTIFLALNSPEFCNKFIRSVPNEIGLITLSSYLSFWALAYFLVTMFLIFFKKEEPEIEPEQMGIIETYQKIFEMLKLPHLVKLLGVLLISKIGFICNDAVTGLKLLEMGFKKEDLALTVLIDFPFQILFGFYAAKWSTGPRPLKPWLYAVYGRLFFSFVSMFVVQAFPSGGVTPSYVVLVVVMGVLTSFTSTVQFVGLSAFFNQIADPYIGGTYMTFLNTLSNLGGTWPKYFILEAVDHFTTAQCSINTSDNQILECAKEDGKKLCKELGGKCSITSDGYYYVNTITVIIAVALFMFYIVRQIRALEGIPPKVWRIRRD